MYCFKLNFATGKLSVKCDALEERMRATKEASCKRNTDHPSKRSFTCENSEKLSFMICSGVSSATNRKFGGFVRSGKMVTRGIRARFGTCLCHLRQNDHTRGHGTILDSEIHSV